MKISGDCWHATQRVAIDSTWYIGIIVHKLRCLQHLIHHLPECQEDGHLTALFLSTSQKKGNIIKKLNVGRSNVNTVLTCPQQLSIKTQSA
jgi:hypothetical protein